MKRLKAFWVPIWFGPRAYWTFAVLAMLFTLAAPLHALWPAAVAASLFVLAALVADLALLPGPAAVSVRRVQPEPFAMRVRTKIAYVVQNRSRVALHAAIVEAPSALLAYDADECLLEVPPGSEADAERGVLPVARGSGQLGDLYLWYRSPIGLLRRRVRSSQQQEFRVYPDLSAVERYGSLRVRNRLIEAGLRRMRLRGTGTEFESVREWSSGDPFRAIDWKATARSGKVMVAQYEVERSQNVMILLDAGRLMMARVGDQRKFDYAITAALSVATVASLANDKVGVIAFAREILRAVAPRQSGRSLDKIAAQMHDIEPRFEEADYHKAFAYLRTHVHKRSLVIFFTDIIDPAAQSAALAQLGSIARRHLVVCVFMNDAAVETALATVPDSTASAYEHSVALELRGERVAAAAYLTRMGVRVIDVPAASLTTALIDRYLEIKQRGEL